MLKYIRTRHNEIIIFSDSIDHDKFKSLDPASAGFLMFFKKYVTCYGDSVTLGLKADPEMDTDLVAKKFSRKPYIHQQEALSNTKDL